jgi:hypothetical protein
MGSILQLLKYIPDLPSLFALIGDVQTAIKSHTEASIDLVLNDIKPFVVQWCPGIPEAEVDATAADLIAIVTLTGNHSIENCAVVAAVIVESLPKFGLAATQEHTDALVKALSDYLGDFGLGKPTGV